MSLEEFGWTPAWRERATSIDGGGAYEPARVVADLGETLRVRIGGGERTGRIAGSLKHEARDRTDLPAVGDWVLVDAVDEESCRVRWVLPRASVFVRKAAGAATEPQVVAANVDRVAIVTSFGRDINPRRVERYLAVAWESAAEPIVVVTKLDLAEQPDDDLARLESVAFGVPIFAVSNETGVGLAELAEALPRGGTVALLGSSGVGKSTLLRSLADESEARVGRVRTGDGKGRHTTTHRELYRGASGVLFIDTPGMRELQPWEGDGAESVFADLEELARSCRFGDCSHRTEPGCALREAADSGDLDADRVEAFLKLQREAIRLERMKDHRGRLDEKRFTKMIHRSLRDHPKYNR